MREIAGKTAFVTGGASGIGLALGRAFAETGMKVMLADIEPGALATAVESLKGIGPDVRGITCDVADPASVDRAAEESYDAFGPVHVVCNNAGVATSGGIDNISLEGISAGSSQLRRASRSATPRLMWRSPTIRASVLPCAIGRWSFVSTNPKFDRCRSRAISRFSFGGYFRKP